jgi:hypothetical protein
MNKLKTLRGLRHVLDIAVLLAVIVMAVLFAQTAGVWPVPAVAGADGNGGPFKYGVRMLLLGLFLAGGGFIGLLFLFSRFQRLYRYPVKITAKNVEVQYVLAKIMLSLNQLICAVYICVLMAGVYRADIEIPSAAFCRLTAAAVTAGALATGVYVVSARGNR